MKGELLEGRDLSRISKSTARVFHVIHAHWPINPVEVAHVLGDKGKVKSLSAKYIYHFKKLADEELIRLKMIGNTYIAWPTDVEKLRVIHELMRGL